MSTALVLPGLPALALERLEASDLPVTTNQGRVETVTAVVCSGGTAVPASLMDLLPRLKGVVVHGVGYDGVDAQHARRRGIVVTNTPDVLTDDVADLALNLILSTLRATPQAERFLRVGEWAAGGRFPLSRRATGLRYGVLGLGRIGQAIARRLEPIAGSIAYHSRRPVEGVAYTHHPDARSLAAAVDVLVVATPGGAATRHLVDAAVLAALGPNGVLINIARGEVVDQDALIAALAQDRRDGKGLGGAGLDVFDGEPRVPEALLNDPRCVLTPHVGSATAETRLAMADLMVENLRAVLDGRAPITAV